jgi:hypothetical protein
MLRRLSTPTSWVYILAHAVLIILGYALARTGSSLMVAIGSSLVAAGITGWVIFVYVLFSQSLSERVQIFTRFGLTLIFDTRSVHIRPEYDRRLNLANDGIDIMGFGLQSLRQDYGNDFESWRNRAKVRILMLDPTFPLVNQSYAMERDKEEHDDVGNIEKNVQRFLEELAPILQSQGAHSFEVRLYRCLPTLNIFRIDDEMFWGPYLIGKPSRSNPTFVAAKGGILFEKFKDHFDHIWANKELSVSVADYLKERASRADVV